MKSFRKVINFFNQQGHQVQLDAYYQQIPSGSCSACPKCCYDNVPLSVVEFAYILTTTGDRINRYKAKVEQWYLNQYNCVQPCIFLENGLCEIYRVRPLTCRLFGHQSKTEQLKRIKKVKQDKAKMADWLYKAYSITVVPEVVEHVIEPCDFTAEKPFTKAQANQLFDNIAMLSRAYYQNNFIDETMINLTLIEWLLLYFDNEEELFTRLLACYN